MQYGWTPLHVAAQYGHAAVVEVLLERGAAIDKTDRVRPHRFLNPALYICVAVLLDGSCTCDYQRPFQRYLLI